MVCAFRWLRGSGEAAGGGWRGRVGGGVAGSAWGRQSPAVGDRWGSGEAAACGARCEAARRAGRLRRGKRVRKAMERIE